MEAVPALGTSLKRLALGQTLSCLADSSRVTIRVAETLGINPMAEWSNYSTGCLRIPPWLNIRVTSPTTGEYFFFYHINDYNVLWFFI
jgi:hypothetical protein